MWLNKILVVFLTLYVLPSMAGDKLFIYPKNSQSAQQQEKDEYLCFVKSKKVTRIDPNTLTQPSKSTRVRERVEGNPNRGGAEKGQAIGTVAGAVIGHNHHHTVGGAIVGSIIGGIVGQSIEASGREKQRKIARKKAKEQAKKQAIERAEYRENIAIFNEYFSRCMADRGYVVK